MAPYSGVFWTAKDTEEKGHPTDINIDLDGTINIGVKITVNGDVVFEDSKCSRHTQYGWNYVRVEFFRDGAYGYKSAAFYGRKSAASKWVKLIDLKRAKGNAAYNSDVKQEYDVVYTPSGAYIDSYDKFLVPTDYVEFGFEFDILAGTNWPYSDVFWTASDNEKKPASTIYITTGGTVRIASLEIQVNNETVFKDSNCSSHAPHYFKQDDTIRVKTFKSGVYLNKSTAFYARKADSVAWTKIKSWTNGDQEFYIPDSEGYVEYGFEFDITAGTNWPYSNVFWTEADSAKETLEDVYIDIGGAVRTASIGIWVNGKKVVSNSNCDSHHQYYWRTRDNIRVQISDSGAYNTNSRNFYARKSGGKWELKYKKGDPTTFYLSSDYVEFGFEFNITWGTNWPYSNVFLTEAQSADNEVKSIDIDIGGAVRTATISIYVNSERIFRDGNCSNHSQHSWN